MVPAKKDHNKRSHSQPTTTHTAAAQQLQHRNLPVRRKFQKPYPRNFSSRRSLVERLWTGKERGGRGCVHNFPSNFATKTSVPGSGTKFADNFCYSSCCCCCCCCRVCRAPCSTAGARVRGRDERDVSRSMEKFPSFSFSPALSRTLSLSLPEVN